EGTCDVCGGHDLYQRADDNPETVKNRLEVNIKESAPILEHYTELGLVKTIDGGQAMEKVTEDIQEVLG
ncbi:MAG TPA: adenylate kinase, partial [Lactococcus sp.]|nr:adenylate kinase [Lactococcus sp.]